LTELDINYCSERGWSKKLQADTHWLQAHRHEFQFVWVELTPPGLELLQELSGQDLEIAKKPRPVVAVSDQQLMIRLPVPQRRGQRLILKNMLLVQQPGILWSLQEGPRLELEPNWLSLARQRVLESHGLALLQELMQMGLEQYFKTLDEIEARMHKLEEEIVANPRRQQLIQAHQMKRDLLHLRRAIWPLRDRLSSGLRQSPTSPQSNLLIDLNQSCLEILGSIETYQNLVRSLTELFVGSLTRKRNEALKVFTVIITLFAPITFFIPIYGMNFSPLPEQQNPLGYSLCILPLVASAMLTGGWIYANGST
jgi:magnesium transporter